MAADKHLFQGGSLEPGQVQYLENWVEIGTEIEPLVEDGNSHKSTWLAYYH